MAHRYQVFRDEVARLADHWAATGLPSRQRLDEEAVKLDQLRRQLKVDGIVDAPPRMATATLDDGLGQGLAIIEIFSAAIGIPLISLGLMQPPGAIIDACCRHQPDYLGLTVLQFDSEDDLIQITTRLPLKTHVVAGGPVFAGNDDFAARTGIHFAAKNVAAFMRFMLNENTPRR